MSAATSAGSRSRTTGAALGSGPERVLGHVNRVLAPHGFRLGPDPASTDIACVGGVIANNSGGMRCGVTHDSYETVRALTFVLPSGTCDRQRRRRRRAALRRRRARARSGPARDPGRDPRRRGAGRADPAQVRDQEHDRLPAVRVPRRRDAGRDLPPPAGRLRGHARRSSPRRSSRPCGSRTRTTVSWLHFAGVDAALEPVRDFVAAGGERRRADGGTGADRRLPQHPRDAGELARARPVLGRAAGRVRRRRRRRARRRRGAGGRGARRPRPDPRARVRPRSGDGSRSTGRCARACTGWSAGCGRPGPR